MSQCEQTIPTRTSPLPDADPFNVAAAGTALAIGADCLERLANAFETSARRTRLVMYPAMVAFIVLAAYGFYLIYSLANDVHFLTRSADRNMTILADEMTRVSDNVGRLRDDLSRLAVNMESVSGNLDSMTLHVGNLDAMRKDLDLIGNSVQGMNMTTWQMRGDMAQLNHAVARPISGMTSWMPW